MTTRHHLLLAGLAFAKLGCAAGGDDDAALETYNLGDPEGVEPPLAGMEDRDFHGDLDRPTFAPLAAGTTVAQLIAARDCSTAPLRPLSLQIADQMTCLKPGGFAHFAASSAIDFTSSAVLPYLAPAALTALQAASRQHALQVNSGFRTIAQQYTLYKWSLSKSCGIAVAAKPGASNHESGRAIDLHNWSAAKSAMTSHGWAHDVAGDDVHFDYLNTASLNGLDVKAFQTLWNLNHPSEKLVVDGAWGAASAAAMGKTPVAGFATGPSCDDEPASWDRVIRADLDGNGDDELGLYAGGAFAWYPMASDGKPGSRLSSATIGSSWDQILGLDADGDGADSLAFYDGQTGAFAVYVASSAGTLGAARSQTTLSPGWTAILAADFDGDHRDELVFYNAASGAYAVYATTSDGSPGAKRSELTLGTGWTQLLAIDVTGDGHPELGFYNASNGAFAIYDATSAGALASRRSASTLATGWTSIQPLQATGSGTSQLAFYRQSGDSLSLYTVDDAGQPAALVATYPLHGGS